MNADKCEFFRDQIQFCGLVIDKDGLHKTPEKVEAVLNVPHPENVSQLRGFLGLVYYYARFIPNLAGILHPLHKCLEKDKKWEWTRACQDAFVAVKTAVTSDQVLTDYDPEKTVTLATDASPYGLGAVLSHTMEDGSERPISFASRSLSRAEQNYAQLIRKHLDWCGV